MLAYKSIEIFTSEEARWKGRPLAEALVAHVKGLKLPARCLVTRATDGCYESGEIASHRIEVLSVNMPLRIVIVLPAAECPLVLPEIDKMVTDGIVAVHDLPVVSHKTRTRLLPRHLRVRDIMTPSPRRVTPETPLDEVARLLLGSIFTGVPVVDAHQRPVGIITQGDLIFKGGMPLRLGLLASCTGEALDGVMAALAGKRAEEAMSAPVVAVAEERPVSEAVAAMVERKVKRLPVTGEGGRLTGMLSRLDIFRAVMRESPDWASFWEQSVQVGALRRVADIMRRDTHSVLPQTPLAEVIRIIDADDIQRVAVVDPQGRFLGLISDSDLLASVSQDNPEGFLDLLARLSPFSIRGKKLRAVADHLPRHTAAEVMNRDIVTIMEGDPIEKAIGIMTERGFKRLPVIDGQGRFQGMVSRDSLLRTGFASSRPPGGISESAKD